MQWSSPNKSQQKPGGQSWSPQPMAATTGANYRPMVSNAILYLIDLCFSYVNLKEWRGFSV